MIKITRFEGAEEREGPDWPWWSFARVIAWIIDRDPDPFYLRNPVGSAYWHADTDFPPPERRAFGQKELHRALAAGEVTAFGLRPDTAPPEALRDFDWLAREPHSIEGHLWVTEPFTKFKMRRADVLSQWPPRPNKRGRPPEFDPARIMAIYDEVLATTPSDRKAVQATIAKYEKETGKRPSAPAVRGYLKSRK